MPNGFFARGIVKLVAGLGNPGTRYRHTRHNVGFGAIEALAKDLGNVQFSKEKFHGLMAETTVAGGSLLLLKPLTMMNNSGLSVGQCVRYTNISPESVLVICDDINLPLGKLRLRPRGSNGGHNGLRSIIAHLGTQDFPRLRIGIGDKEKGQELTRHVLGTFQPDEWPDVEAAIERASAAARAFLTDGIDAAMNAFNR